MQTFAFQRSETAPFAFQKSDIAPLAVQKSEIAPFARQQSEITPVVLQKSEIWIAGTSDTTLDSRYFGPATLGQIEAHAYAVL